MIPRLRPSFFLRELITAFFFGRSDAEVAFERGLAEKFGFEYGLFFPYGRSALYALLKALGWVDREIVVPAYTCVVVPHAIVLSGNQVRFADCEPDHFNVSATGWAQAITIQTKMVIPTTVFGYPIDIEGCYSVISARAPGALVLVDAAHGFGVKDEGGFQFRNADGVLLGLGIGKIITSLYGGALLLKDKSLYTEVKNYRDLEYSRAKGFTSLNRFLYGLTVWGAFREPLFSLVDALEHNTNLLYRFTEYYYAKSGPTLPDNVTERPPGFQAALGLRQLGRYDEIIDQRRTISARYEAKLAEEGFWLFSWAHPPTYPHFPLAVVSRPKVIMAMRQRGIQLGGLIDYSCPDLPGYEKPTGSFPNARFWSKSIINLPNWPGLTNRQIDRVVEDLCRCRDQAPNLFIGDL